MKISQMPLLLLTEASKVEFIVNQRGDAITSAASRDAGLKPANVKLDDAAAIAKHISEKVGEKYLVWVIGQYIKGTFKLEDLPKIKAELATFEKVKSKLPVKDLGQYKSLRDLYAALKTVAPEDAVSGKQQKMAAKLEGADYVINSPDFKVLNIKTYDAACLYGSNTRWCTTTEDDPSMFEHYVKEGKIYIILAGDRKYQVHVESEQFMDAEDNEIDKQDIEYLSKYPQYKEFLNMLIKKHYFPNDKDK